jgi:hypothetical protein
MFMGLGNQVISAKNRSVERLDWSLLAVSKSCTAAASQYAPDGGSASSCRCIESNEAVTRSDIAYILEQPKLSWFAEYRYFFLFTEKI